MEEVKLDRDRFGAAHGWRLAPVRELFTTG